MLDFSKITAILSKRSEESSIAAVGQKRQTSLKSAKCHICKTVLWTSLLSLLLVETAILVPSFRSELNALRISCMEQGEKAMAFLKYGIRHSAPTEVTTELLKTAMASDTVYAVSFFNQQRQLISHHGLTAPKPEFLKEPPTNWLDTDFKDIQEFDDNVLLTEVVERSGELIYITVALDGSHINSEVWNYLRRVMLAVFIICLCVSGSLAIVMHRYARHLQYQAFHDARTQLPNEAGLSHYLQQAIDDKQSFHLLVFDIDSFEIILERWGSENSETILNQVVNRVLDTLPNDAWLARIRDDYFGVVIPANSDTQDLQSVQSIVSLLQTTITKPLTIEDTTTSITACIGTITHSSNSTETAVSTVQHADQAIRKAKTTGSNRVVHYGQALIDERQQHTSIISRLRVALAEERLSLVYQPQYYGSNIQLAGAECLMRWNDPEIGPVSPGKFIPLAERTGIIIEYGAWALKTAVKQFVDWRNMGLDVPRISVNLSPAQFVDENLVSMVTDLVATYQLAPGQLELEITESAIIESADLTIDTMKTLSQIGVEFAIDDFGTGHSSLANLGSFPFNRLKIDQSFVMGLTTSEPNKVIVKNCIELAHQLNMDVVAEGVEHKDELSLLNSWQCDIIQGYLLGKPLSADEFLETASLIKTKAA